MPARRHGAQLLSATFSSFDILHPAIVAPAPVDAVVFAIGRYAGGPLAPPWIIVPFAAIALLVLAAHVLLLQHADIAPSRRRIRIANGLVMMFATPIITFAFSFADPAEPRVFTIAWMLVSGLLLIILSLASADVINTWRLWFRERRRLHLELADAGRDALAAATSRLDQSVRLADPHAP